MNRRESENEQKIRPAPVRQIVQVRLPDGRAFDGPVGTTIEEFIEVTQPEAPGRIVAAVINNKLRELSHELTSDVDLVPISTAESDGVRIYRRSLSFLLIAAGYELFPDHAITIHHSMPFGGYYCELQDGHLLTTEELDCLRDRMRQLVEEDLSITQVRVPLEEALELFRANNDREKADLFARRRKDYLTLYELNGARDYFHGFMVPSTGYLDLFDLRAYHNGFILQFPRRHEPYRLQPFEDEPRLAQVFQDYNKWLDVVGVPSVSTLNRAITSGRIQEVILVAEALHERQLASTAGDIARREPPVKIVLISGPTSAGKTTLSKRLAVQLLGRGIHPVAVNLDNYFVNREDTPLDEHGEYDFEALEAVDLQLFQRHLRQLLKGETIVQPVYDFREGKRKPGSKLTLGPQHLLIVEGIHALNPRLTEGIPREAMYRIFISAFTQLNLDRHNRVPTTDTRMLRRIVRDAANRGYNATATIRRWPSVRRGEKKYIFPHQNNADIFFNSALVYELSLLKPLAQPLLLQVEPGTMERIEANRLLAFLQWFDPVPPDVRVPSDSILREFIGGSILDSFQPWHH
ncbi:MAG: nucleoside kinase [Chloroflexota bacterium]